MPLKAVIFDFDLTLADSLDGIAECINHALRRMDLPVAGLHTIRRHVGLSLERTFHVLSGIDDADRAREFARRFIERADEVMIDRTRILPDVEPALTQVRARGLRTAIVSTKFRYRIEGVLRRDGIDALFDMIVGGEDVARFKPDPEGLQCALNRLGVASAEAVYVGDHAVDAEAAQLAGLPFLAAPGCRSADFADYPVHGFLNSLLDLPHVISG